MKPADRSAPSFIQTVLAVIWKDLTAELRSREILSAMLVFAFLVVIIFNFALELETGIRSSLTAGILWVTFTFAGTLGLNRSMAIEKDRGCLDGLLLAPVDRSAIYFGKMLGNLAFMLLVELVVIPVFSLLYNQNLLNVGLVVVTLLGSVGYSAVGTLLASMAIQARTRDILLPILLFPVVIPLVLAAVRASTGYMQALPAAEILPWMNLLVVYDIIFLVVGWLVYDKVVEE
jgi:heme exporter protein B